MGLITGILTLPLAPVRGVVWLAEQLEAEAQRQRNDPQRIRAELDQLEKAYEEGILTAAERDQQQDVLVTRLLMRSEVHPGARDG